MLLRQFAIIKGAYERLENYAVEVVETDFGKLSYIDEGSGDAVLLSHGIFGGYDQAYVSLTNLA